MMRTLAADQLCEECFTLLKQVAAARAVVEELLIFGAKGDRQPAYGVADAIRELGRADRDSQDHIQRHRRDDQTATQHHRGEPLAASAGGI